MRTLKGIKDIIVGIIKSDENNGKLIGDTADNIIKFLLEENNLVVPPSEIEFTEIVRSLNVDLFKKTGEQTEQFSYTTTGFIQLILFGNHVLWNSDDDERIFDEDKDDYEDLENFIRNQFKDYIAALSKLEL